MLSQSPTPSPTIGTSPLPPAAAAAAGGGGGRNPRPGTKKPGSGERDQQRERRKKRDKDGRFAKGIPNKYLVFPDKEETDKSNKVIITQRKRDIIFREFPPLKKICYGKGSNPTKENEAKFFKDYVNIHKQLVTGNSVRGSKNIIEFFTKLKELPKEYTVKEWELTSEIPACENVVADEDYWDYRERFFPSLTEKKMQGVYEIKRELLSHSAVILNPNIEEPTEKKPTKEESSKKDLNSTEKKPGKEELKKEDSAEKKSAEKKPSRFPFLSYFKYDETTPLYQEFSANSPYIELNPSSNFSSSMRRSCLKPLPLETIPKPDESSSQGVNEAHNGETHNIFSQMKKDSPCSQRDFSTLFSAPPSRDFLNGYEKPNAVKLEEGENGYKVVYSVLENVQGSVHSYLYKRKTFPQEEKEQFIEFIRKKKIGLEKMLANPDYNIYVDAINDSMNLVEKTIHYIQGQSN